MRVIECHNNKCRDQSQYFRENLVTLVVSAAVVLKFCPHDVRADLSFPLIWLRNRALMFNMGINSL